MKQVSGILPALMMLLISLPVSANADETYDAQGCEGWRRGGGAKTMAPACRNGDRARIKATHARDRLIVKLRSDTP
ncbi:MAG TPA: hypothetical protein DCO77_10600, partial [Nitrospiraceae bacterium]|nr:hypothetical protein [Nitrospiraceae bacterium]